MIVVPQNLVTVPQTPIQGDISDLNAVFQSHDINVDNFSREEVVPLYLWANSNFSKDYQACIQQSGDQFGYIPLNGLKLYHGPEGIRKETFSFYRNTN